MNWNKFVMASVVGAVLLVVIGLAWHLLLFMDYYTEAMADVGRPEPLIPVAILGEVLRGVLLAYIYPFGYQGGEPWKEGLRFGVALGLFSAMIALIYTAVLNFSGFGAFWMDLVFFAVQGGIAGIGIAWVYGKQGARAR